MVVVGEESSNRFVVYGRGMDLFLFWEETAGAGSISAVRGGWGAAGDRANPTSTTGRGRSCVICDVIPLRKLDMDSVFFISASCVCSRLGNVCRTKVACSLVLRAK
jgi:hypothetical protein